MSLPTAEFVRSILAYSPATGIFIWKRRPALPPMWNVRCAGKVAGVRMRSGHIAIAIGNVKYYAHRLAWLVMTGKWPEGEVDHKDLNATNNAWSNLRQATSSQNKCNRGKPSGSAASKLKGVTWHAQSSQWRARIQVRGKAIHIGLFDSEREAHAAYCIAAERHHGDFARTA